MDCAKCSMPLDNKNKCVCDPTVCCFCCDCGEDCESCECSSCDCKENKTLDAG